MEVVGVRVRIFGRLTCASGQWYGTAVARAAAVWRQRGRGLVQSTGGYPRVAGELTGVTEASGGSARLRVFCARMPGGKLLASLSVKSRGVIARKARLLRPESLIMRRCRCMVLYAGPVRRRLRIVRRPGGTQPWAKGEL